MKIVNVCLHYEDKLGYQEYYLGKEWAACGHEVHFITSDRHFDFPDYNNTVKQIIGDKVVGTGIFHTDYGVTIHRLKGTNKYLTGRVWLKGLRKKLLDIKPDIVISHGIISWHSIRLLFLHDLLKCRIVFDDHMTLPQIRRDFVTISAYRLFGRLFGPQFARKADKIIGISHTCIDVIKRYYGIKKGPLVMIPLGSDNKQFRPNLEMRNRRRQQLGAKEHDIVVTYTGKMYETKNVHLILEALNDLSVCRDKSIIIYLVGDVTSSYRPILADAINRSIHKVVMVKGVPLDDLVSVYNASDIAVWPDHLTNSTVDASACGCPVICSEYMKERVSFNNGIAIRPGSLSHLKDALALLINDEQLRATMGNNAVRYVEQEASWATIAEKFIA